MKGSEKNVLTNFTREPKFAYNCQECVRSILINSAIIWPKELKLIGYCSFLRDFFPLCTYFVKKYIFTQKQTRLSARKTFVDCVARNKRR